MKPFQPTPEQLEAILAGATKLWFPFSNLTLDHFSNSDNVGHDFVWEDPELTGHFVSGVEVFSPLQPGEQYFCMQNTHCIFTATAVEVKQVQDLELRQMVALGIKNETAMTERFVPWHDSQYPDKPYSSNPFGFLVDIRHG